MSGKTEDGEWGKKKEATQKYISYQNIVGEYIYRYRAVHVSPTGNQPIPGKKMTAKKIYI